MPRMREIQSFQSPEHMCLMQREKKRLKPQLYESVCHIWGQPSNLRKNQAESVIRTETGVLCGHHLNST